MAQMLERMVKDGLLVRKQDPSDGGKSIFSLSRSGVDILPRVGVVLTKGNSEVFSAFNGDELSTYAHTRFCYKGSKGLSRHYWPVNINGRTLG